MKKLLYVLLTMSMMMTGFGFSAFAMQPPIYQTPKFSNTSDLVEWINTEDIENFQSGHYKNGVAALRQKGEILVPSYQGDLPYLRFIEVFADNANELTRIAYYYYTETERIVIFCTPINPKNAHLLKDGIDSYFKAQYSHSGASAVYGGKNVYRTTIGGEKQESISYMSYEYPTSQDKYGYHHIYFIKNGFEIRIDQNYENWDIKRLQELNLDLVPLIWDNPFDDVVESDWFYKDVEYAERNQLMGGTSTTAFSPNVPISRAAFVTSLWRMEGNPERDYNNKFLDVSDDAWYSKAVLWASGRGYVKGVSEELFAPEAAISRQDIAVILKRYLDKQYKYSVDDEYKIFADEEEISDYAKDAVQTLSKLGILNEKGGRIDPKGNMTRAEAAAMLHRMSKIIKCL